MTGPTELIAEDRLYWYLGRVFLTVRNRYEKYQNQYFENQWWHCLEQWFVFIGFAPRIHGWFSAENWQYDGHTLRSASFLGIAFGFGYTYDAKPMETENEAP